MVDEVFDYVIVGAGSAGCTLASRLTESAEVRVLVLEAGGWDRDPMIAVPLAWGRNVLQRRHDWMYSTEPQAGLAQRRIPIYRGKLIGGSSSINAMAYVRGHRGDYDRWAASGLPGWSYAEVLPYFRRSETWEGGADAWRGAEGPLSTSRSSFPDPLTEAFLAAGLEAGHPYTEDYTGAVQEGFSRAQSTLRNGSRCSAALAYLHPARRRPGLSVRTGALALGIAWEGARAAGVRYAQGSQVHLARARREVILCAGAINTPQLLMLSGVGDAGHLQSHGIEVRLALPGVGANLQDHLSAGVDFLRREPGPLHKALRLDRIACALVQRQLFGTGIAGALPNNVMAYLKSAPGEPMPDIQLLFRAAAMDAGAYLPPFKAPFADSFGCRPVPLRPTSRGRLLLASADPAAAVRIEPNFLSTAEDLRLMRTGIRMAREVFRQPALAGFIAREIAPGPQLQSDADLDDYARRTSSTVYHPLGTCRMGDAADPMAVVDPELRLLGAEGLRVVDASVMPDLVGGNINGPVIMIAERAADLIRGRAPLPAAVLPA
jgi:choline dehydrogenase/4-pyridoxate dehydrogenase